MDPRPDNLGNEPHYVDTLYQAILFLEQLNEEVGSDNLITEFQIAKHVFEANLSDAPTVKGSDKHIQTIIEYNSPFLKSLVADGRLFTTTPPEGQRPHYFSPFRVVLGS